MYIGRTVVCAGFISAGAENKIRGGRKEIRGGRIFLPPFFSVPLAEFDSYAYAPPVLKQGVHMHPLPHGYARLCGWIPNRIP